MKALIRRRRVPMVTKRILLAVFALSVSPAETRRGITPEDYYRFEFLTDPHLSPDGKLVAYVVTTVDDKQARRVSTIWMTAADGSRQPWAFTTAASSTHPRWRPDGRVLA